MYLAGIDLGTTGCKSMVFDDSGNIAGEHYIEYGLVFTPDGIEQDAELWWEHAKTALKKAIDLADIPAADLKGIAVASQGIASVAVDAGGRPLDMAVSWYDTRAKGEAEEMAIKYGDNYLFETTGRHASSLFFPQVLHLKRIKPDLYESAKYFLMPHDYLVYRLCGKAVTDYTMASGTLCFDTGNHRWIGEMFDHYKIGLEKFPELRPFGSIAGKMLPYVAGELGLSEDTIVAVGMQDQKAAALGAGIASGEGIMTLSLGTASAISCISPEKRIDKSGRLNCHAFDGRRWIMENYVGASGSSLKWIRDIMFPNMSFKEMDELAGKSPIGSGNLFFFPALDEKQGKFTGISLSTTKGDMVRAALEGIAYEVRRCVEIQKGLFQSTGSSMELRAYGGGAGSELWCQILADVLNMPVALPRTKETSNLGAAICAGMALGLFLEEKSEEKSEGKPIVESIAVFTGGIKKRFEPDPANARVYEEAFKKYLYTEGDFYG